MDLTGKDHPLVALVRRLERDLGGSFFALVDHWGGDRPAIGLARPDDPEVLIYLAVRIDGGLFCEGEVPGAQGYAVVGRGDGVECADVLRAVRGHLAEPGSTGPASPT